MKKFNKKAMEEINPIILALIIFVILLALVGVIIKATMRQGGEDVCLASVVAADKTSKFDVLEIKCEMYDAGKINPQGATDEKKKEDAMKQVAELMRKCWKEFGEGKRDPFKSAWFKHKTVCFVCSKFSFEAKTNIPEADFMNFLKNIKISDEITYYDYFKGPYSDKNNFIIDELKMVFPEALQDWSLASNSYTTGKEKAFMEPEKDYAVVLHVFDIDKYEKLFWGARKNQYDIFIVPYENIERLSCERLQG